MTENDKLSDKSTTRVLLEIDTDGEGDDDVHFCKRCHLMFTSLQDYLDHKVKHDMYKVSFSRNGRNKSLVVSMLIQSEEAKTEKTNNETQNVPGTQIEVQGKKRGRKRKSEERQKEPHPEENTIYSSSYSCVKCNLKFNREAALRRHITFVHDEETAEDSDEDKTVNYEEKPNLDDGKETQLRPHIPRQYNVLKNPDGGDRPYECYICQSTFKESSILRTHMLTHSERRDFPCTADGCTYAFKTKGALKRHIRRHTGERPYTCGACGRSFTESGALTRHMRSRVPCTNKTDSDLPRYKMKMRLPNQQVNTRPGPVFAGEESVVQISDLVAAALNSDTLHTNPDGSIQVVIASDPSDVQLDGNSEEVVVINLNEQDDQQPSHRCQVCKELLPSLTELKEHLRKHITDTPNRCKSCHFVSDDKEQLVSHYREHHPEETEDIVSVSVPFKQTGAKTAMKQLLETHYEDDTDRLTQKCPVCLKSFRGSSYLKLHMKSHIGENPYKCSVCEKSFVTKDTLNKHFSVHNTERHYKCGDCGKLFKRISHVREHFKIHSGDRPYPCSVCSKAFKSGNAMRVHMRTHTNVLPYECKYCHRKFREKASLQRHIRMHTGERPFRCYRCGRAFAEHGTLNRHLKAKVPCTGHTVPLQREEGADSTVLTEFSSVVADTQQYIMSDTDQQVEEATEYVVVQTGSEDLQNVEIITDGDGSVLEGVEVTGDYVLINEDGEHVKIINSHTGETVATMAASAVGESSSGQIIVPQAEVIESSSGQIIVPHTEVNIEPSSGQIIVHQKEVNIEETGEESLIQTVDGDAAVEINNESCVQQLSEDSTVTNS